MGNLTAITQERIASFLGIDLSVAPVSQPVDDVLGKLDHEGWPCFTGSPLRALLDTMLPISGGPTTSITLANAPMWCMMPDERRKGYTIAVIIQLGVGSWKSREQQVYLPVLMPLPVDGQVTVAGKTMASWEALEAWYERALRKEIKAVAKRLGQLERHSEHAQTLFPHDLWYPY